MRSSCLSLLSLESTYQGLQFTIIFTLWALQTSVLPIRLSNEMKKPKLCGGVRFGALPWTSNWSSLINPTSMIVLAHENMAIHCVERNVLFPRHSVVVNDSLSTLHYQLMASLPWIL